MKKHGMLVGAKDMEELANMMIRQAKRRGAKRQSWTIIHHLAIGYTAGKEFPSVAMDGKEDPYWSQISEISDLRTSHS
jgi:hypothetical protein